MTASRSSAAGVSAAASVPRLTCSHKVSSRSTRFSACDWSPRTSTHPPRPTGVSAPRGPWPRRDRRCSRCRGRCRGWRRPPAHRCRLALIAAESRRERRTARHLPRRDHHSQRSPRTRRPRALRPHPQGDPADVETVLRRIRQDTPPATRSPKGLPRASPLRQRRTRTSTKASSPAPTPSPGSSATPSMRHSAPEGVGPVRHLPSTRAPLSRSHLVQACQRVQATVLAADKQ